VCTQLKPHSVIKLQVQLLVKQKLNGYSHYDNMIETLALVLQTYTYARQFSTWFSC